MYMSEYDSMWMSESGTKNLIEIVKIKKTYGLPIFLKYLQIYHSLIVKQLMKIEEV